MATATELTEAQTAEVAALLSAMESLGNALVACRAAGLDPGDAFQAAGIEIPSFARPVLNMMFK